MGQTHIDRFFSSKANMNGVRLFIAWLFINTTFCCNSQNAERDIILINVDTLDRIGIANLVKVINKQEPKVIAIDLQFVHSTEYSKDWLLFNELSKCKSLVMSSLIGDYTGEEIEYKRFVEESQPQFLTNAKTGFTNTVTERDGFETLRRFSTKELVDGQIEYHFAIRIVMEYDSTKAMNFVRQSPKIVFVDYKGGQRKFKTLLSTEVLNRKRSLGEIKGKIVMLGFLGPGNEDKFYTPLNKDSKEPDMYGLEYLAHILAQVLESN
ncbi:MAG: CHASE2 domain-containing protein [Cyclobacteriaceae bacterium]|nr:CHASE2 domain-containing protein [Cyclobacteriaceae bacterium]